MDAAKLERKCVGNYARGALQKCLAHCYYRTLWKDQDGERHVEICVDCGRVYRNRCSVDQWCLDGCDICLQTLDAA